jgi:hypothetical protein
MVVHADFGEVEVTLADLDADLEQEADGAPRAAAGGRNRR